MALFHHVMFVISVHSVLCLDWLLHCFIMLCLLFQFILFLAWIDYVPVSSCHVCYFSSSCSLPGLTIVLPTMETTTSHPGLMAWAGLCLWLQSFGYPLWLSTCCAKKMMDSVRSVFLYLGSSHLIIAGVVLVNMLGVERFCKPLRWVKVFFKIKFSTLFYHHTNRLIVYMYIYWVWVYYVGTHTTRRGGEHLSMLWRGLRDVFPSVTRFSQTLLPVLSLSLSCWSLALLCSWQSKVITWNVQETI